VRRDCFSKTKMVSVKIVSDVVCPFCYIGLRNLEKASEQSGIEINIEWEPFLLESTPDVIPDDGVPLHTALATKFGSANSVKMLSTASPVYRAGLAAGINFNNDRKMYPTFKAHIAVDFIKELQHENIDTGKSSVPGTQQHHKIMKELFYQYFEHAANINDPKTLTQIAKTVSGIDISDGIFDDESRLHRLLTKDRSFKSGKYKISGVPFFIIQGTNSKEISFCGAQPPEVIADHLVKASS
jgi:predicted DsbA family dithiol-disulfide isomerase